MLLARNDEGTGLEESALALAMLLLPLFWRSDSVWTLCYFVFSAWNRVCTRIKHLLLDREESLVIVYQVRLGVLEGHPIHLSFRCSIHPCSSNRAQVDAARLVLPGITRRSQRRVIYKDCVFGGPLLSLHVCLP